MAPNLQLQQDCLDELCLFPELTGQISLIDKLSQCFLYRHISAECVCVCVPLLDEKAGRF